MQRVAGNQRFPGLDRRVWILWGVSVAAVAGVMLMLDPVPQWPSYHAFVDQRTFLGVPNAFNVLSSLPLVLIGLWGVMRVVRTGGGDALLPCYLALFAGVALTGIGSVWYHADPDNARLVWDRLSITVAVMGLLCAVAGECVSPRTGRVLLMPLLAAGAASVAWWIVTEQGGAGDLRPYAIAQFLPPLLMFLMLIMYAPPRSLFIALAGTGLCYGLAKVAELYDGPILDGTGFVSGHSLKHLLVAGAVTWVLVWYSGSRDRLQQLQQSP